MDPEEVDGKRQSADVTRESENSLDRLFSALDGKPTDRGPVRILGIHHDSRDRWIQIARGDDITNTIVLRVSRFASVIHAGAALMRWNTSGTSAPRVVRAMCLVER
jgi:hypothetical protein